MTQEEEDALRGRAIRESKEADNELRLLLIKADGVREQFSRLVLEIDNRVKRARGEDTRRPNPASVIEGTSETPARPDLGRAARGMDNLDSYAKVLNLDALRQLDEEIRGAVIRAGELRKRKRELEL
jgi:hypothetical protein